MAHLHENWYKPWHKNQHLFDPEKDDYFTRPYSVDDRYNGMFSLPNYHLPYNDFDMYEPGDEILTHLVILGPDYYRDSLFEGDEIIIQKGSGYSLMPNDMQWSKSIDDGEVIVCTFLHLLGGDDEEYDYQFLTNGDKKTILDPRDVVINFRYRRQRNAARSIQKAWREHRLNKIIRIQRCVKEWLYREGGVGYNRIMQDFNSLSNKTHKFLN